MSVSPAVPANDNGGTTMAKPDRSLSDAVVDTGDGEELDAFYEERWPLHGAGAGAHSLADDFDFGSEGSGNASAFRRRRPDENRDPNLPGWGGDNGLGGDGFGDRYSYNGNIDDLSPQMSGSPPTKQKRRLTWNRLNAALFFGQALLSAAMSAPVTLVPAMAVSLAGAEDGGDYDYSPYYNMETLEVYSYDENGTKKRWIPFRVRTKRSRGSQSQTTSSSSMFASRLTSVVTLVTALGKFINGVLVDVAGARRLLLIYGTCTCLALVGLRYSTTPSWAVRCCAAVEFFSSINWPAGIVILGAHYGMDGDDTNGRYERGLHVMSLASRCGSLLAIPLSSLLIKWTNLSWRGIAGMSAYAALGGVAVFYFYLTDSPGRVHDPQNPIRTVPEVRTNGGGVTNLAYPVGLWTPPPQSKLQRSQRFCSSAFHTVLPSIRAILGSRVFWAVAAAHAGATMVKSSERILGTYFRDTSSGTVSESKAGAMTVFLSLGMLGGLLVGGKAFARAADSEQGGRSRPHGVARAVRQTLDRRAPLMDAAQLGTKNMIAFFYCLSICMAYVLSFLAMPFVRRALHLPVFVLILQVLASLGLGFGVAVQFYHIPAIVGATFGKNRGLYASYTDGVAALVSSIVWRVVGGAVEEGNPQGGGWAYGWAAVALLLVVCGTLMVKIVELYFVGGGWRHDSPKEWQADGTRRSLPAELPGGDVNGSWMEDEIRSTGFSVDAASPMRKHGTLNVLPGSALEFIGSPARVQSRLASISSQDESDVTTAIGNRAETNLLGIDDDGTLLFPGRDGMQDDLVSFNSILEPRNDPRESESCVRESSVFDDPNYDDTDCDDSFEL